MPSAYHSTAKVASRRIPAARYALFVLWAVSLISALAVVYSTYQSRQAVQALESLRREAIGLKVSQGRFELEKSALGAYPRVESIAQEKLEMRSPPTAQTVLVTRE